MKNKILFMLLFIMNTALAQVAPANTNDLNTPAAKMIGKHTKLAPIDRAKQQATHMAGHFNLNIETQAKLETIFLNAITKKEALIKNKANIGQSTFRYEFLKIEIETSESIKQLLNPIQFENYLLMKKQNRKHGNKQQKMHKNNKQIKK
jgi:hypothetical protein